MRKSKNKGYNGHIGHQTRARLSAWHARRCCTNPGLSAFRIFADLLTEYDVALFASTPSGQHTNENVHSLNVAKKVTKCCDLSCYWMFYCFLTPSCVLLGASAKSVCS